MSWPAQQNCLHCAKCVQPETGGLCPIRFCAKGLISGPCGGNVDGKCEISLESSCVWYAIEENWVKTNRDHFLPRFEFYKNYASLYRHKHTGNSP